MVEIEKTVIMHISDLHFGIEKKDPTVDNAYRKKVLEKFKENYADMITHYPNYAPDILVVSGDIAFSGSPEDYEEAKDFFTYLIDEKLPGNRLTKESVILCFGNHDVQAETHIDFDSKKNVWTDYTARKTLDRPDPDLDFEDFYTYELNISDRYHRFRNAETFCKEMGFVELSHNADSPYKYAYGSRKNVKGIDFISLNTEWDFWGELDKDAAIERMRIGVNLYSNVTESFNNLFDPSTNPRFVVYHRPLEYLHKHEQNDPRLNNPPDRTTGRMIVRQNDVSLNGHTHANELKQNGMHTTITAGSVHQNKRWEFSCNMLFVPKTLVEGRNKCEMWLYEYNSTVFNQPWQIVKSGKDKLFYIYRFKDSKKADEFIVDYDNWSKIRDKLSRANSEERRKTLSQDYSSLKYLASIFTTVWGDEGFNEVINELKEKKLVESLIGKRKENIPGTSSGGFVPKGEHSDYMEKVKSLGLYSTPDGGYYPSDPNRSKK